MSIVLYRKGDTHTVKGIRCELKKIDPEYFSGVPESGWFLSVRDINKAVEPERAETDVQAKEKTIPKDIKTIDGMDNDEIRIAAKLADMADYKTARIRTLKNRLKATECHI